MVLRWTHLLALFTLGCNSEQDAARALGYTQRSWDNVSGRERQPASENKAWFQLTPRERQAATILGYNQRLWDQSETAPQPASGDKAWSELSSCGGMPPNPRPQNPPQQNPRPRNPRPQSPPQQNPPQQNPRPASGSTLRTVSRALLGSQFFSSCLQLACNPTIVPPQIVHHAISL